MVTENSIGLQSDLPIAPGEFLQEELDVIGMTQQELAVRTGRPVQVINEIVKGKKGITHDTALELEKVLGIPAHIWTGLESELQLTKARLRDRLELERQEDWLSQFPVKELEKRGWISKGKTAIETVEALLHFLGVASFTAWRQTPEAVAFRITPGARVSEGSLACWLRKGELEALAIDTLPYDEDIFRSTLSEIRSLVNEPPEVFEGLLQSMCARSGVAFVVTPELPKSGANGAARWITPQKALIQLSLRYRWSDHFWFSFFHESCHILLHRVKEIHLDGINGDAAAEEEANNFAAEALIPRQAWLSFVARGIFARQSLISFAKECGVPPGIVVGRLQHEGYLPYNNLNDLRTQFAWID